MAKTIREINERIRRGQAVVVDAEEIIEIVAEKGTKKAAEEVDVVTTGTFGPMCSSGAFLNTGHTNPRSKFARAWLNDVSAYAGLAAVDVYIGATELREGDPANSVFPGRFEYGGGHVIEDLVAGKDVEFRAEAYPTDCYPRKKVHSWIRLSDLNQAVLTNPRNVYQNYNVAVNRDGKRVIYTYMGVLQPNLANANYCSAGQLSPLLNDPLYRTIGIGTRIFLGGGVGYVWWEGTQHAPAAPRLPNGAPSAPAGTLAVCGDLKTMDPRWLKGVSLVGYGVSLAVGVGIPIPVLDEETVRYTAVSDADLVASVVDYSADYPNCVPGTLGTVTYKELKSGTITVKGKPVPTAGLSSYARAKEIAGILKESIQKGEFLLTEPVAPVPSADSGQKCKPFVERPVS
jgi:uncharacterized protein (DUF39 family)